MMPNEENPAESDIEKVFQGKTHLQVRTKAYPNICLLKEGILPSTDKEREKATEEFFGWVDDNCRFFQEDVPNFKYLNERITIDPEKKADEAKEKADGKAYFQLLNAMDRTMIQIQDIMDELATLNQYLLSFYAHSSSLVLYHADLIEKMEGGEEKVTEEKLEKFKVDNVRVEECETGPASRFSKRIKQLEDEVQKCSSFTFIDEDTFFQSHPQCQKQRTKAIAKGVMKWTFKK